MEKRDSGKKVVLSPTLTKPLPPGQFYTEKFPIYDITEDLDFDLDNYSFKIWGAGVEPVEFSLPELLELFQREGVVLKANFHCVTKWSKENLEWEGIQTKKLLELANPPDDVVQVMAHCLEGYTTNVPIEYLWEEDSIVALKLNGQWLPKEHGAPLRLVVPQLYAWKSAKYLCGLEFQRELIGGFWEERGYHLIGEPWEEQRYTEPFEKIKAWWREFRKIKRKK